MNCIDQVHYIIRTLGELWEKERMSSTKEWERNYNIGLIVHTRIFFDTYNNRMPNERALLHWQYSKRSKEKSARTYTHTTYAAKCEANGMRQRILRGKARSSMHEFLTYFSLDINARARAHTLTFHCLREPFSLRSENATNSVDNRDLISEMKQRTRLKCGERKQIQPIKFINV